MKATDVRAEEIFEAIWDDEALLRLPHLLARASGGRSSIIQWQHASGDFDVMAYSHYTADFVARYAAEWAARDPWVIAFARPDRANVLRPAQELVPELMFARSEIFNEFVREIGDDTYHCAGVSLFTPSGMGIVSVQRSKSAAAFEVEDLVVLRDRIIDLKAVLHTRAALEFARRRTAQGAEVLDALGTAIIVVRRDLRVLEANAEAEAIFADHDGLIRRAGNLCAVDADAQRRLESALRVATANPDPRACSVSISRRVGDPPFLAALTPLAGRTGPARALLLFRRTVTRDLSVESRLRTLFGLTRAEAGVASDLAAGLSVKDAATGNKVQENTVRAQLKAILAKTGCSRQSQLTALIAGLPALR